MIRKFYIFCHYRELCLLTIMSDKCQIYLKNINSICFVEHIPQILAWHLHIVENILLPGKT